LLVEVVGVAQRSGRRREDHLLLAEEGHVAPRGEGVDGEPRQRQSA
jgi:hypothetical protein